MPDWLQQIRYWWILLNVVFQGWPAVLAYAVAVSLIFTAGKRYGQRKKG